jgi:hypothetical protein
MMKHITNTKATFFAMLLLLGSISSQAQSITDSLQAHFKFDGTLSDATANANDLMVASGTLAFTSRSASDSAIVFDGQSSITSINVFDNSDYTSCTISLWVKSPLATNAAQTILQGANVGFGVFMTATSGKIAGFYDFTSSGSVESNDSITDGDWHHVVLQTNGSTTFLYVDGMIEGCRQENLVVGTGASNNRLFLGRTNLGLGNFSGSVDELRIYNRMLSIPEIHRLYDPNYDTCRVTLVDTLTITQFDTTFVTVYDTIAVTDTLYIDITTGLAAPNDVNRMKVYPNPSTGQVFIDNGNYALLPNYSLKIVNTLGQQVFSSLINSPAFMINLSQFGGPGIYFLQIMDPGGQMVEEKKIILR